MKKVLFVCSQNQLRSPTAEQVFSSYKGIEVSSAGTNHDANNPITPELLQWADIIFVMEKAHRNKLQKKFRLALNGKRIICLDIPDEFEFMDPGLIKLLEAKVPRFLPLSAQISQAAAQPSVPPDVPASAASPLQPGRG